MRHTVYSLEIYGPEGDRHPLVEYQSDTPFMAVNIGDALHTMAWPELAPHRYLRVTDVGHVLTENEQRLLHRIMVRTKVEEID